MGKMNDWMTRHVSKYSCSPPFTGIDDAESYATQTFGEFTNGYVQTYVPRGLWFVMKAISNFLPDSGVDAILVTARGVLLDDASTVPNLEAQETALAAFAPVAANEIAYKNALLNTIQWRAGTKDANSAAPYAIQGIKHYLKAAGSTEVELRDDMANYLRSIYDYTSWLADVTEGADADPAFDGWAAYINMIP